jgi:hypothetical protein
MSREVRAARREAATMAEWWGVPAVVLIIALVQLAKQMGFPSKYAGLLAAVMGIAGGAADAIWGSSRLISDIMTGLVAGLSAAGLWSTVKNSAGES